MASASPTKDTARKHCEKQIAGYDRQHINKWNSVVSQQPKILIFDSGVGGLSVYQEIEARLPQLDYYYLFDNAAYPYGELEHHTLIERVDHLVTRFVSAHRIDLVVIACNTASTIVLPSLRAKASQSKCLV